MGDPDAEDDCRDDERQAAEGNTQLRRAALGFDAERSQRAEQRQEGNRPRSVVDGHAR